MAIQGKRGYVDVSGHLVIPAQFDHGADYHEGLCRVLVGTDWQYIDRQGAVVAKGGHTDEDSWNDAEDFHGGLARVHIGGTFTETRDGPEWWRGEVVLH